MPDQLWRLKASRAAWPQRGRLAKPVYQLVGAEIGRGMEQTADSPPLTTVQQSPVNASDGVYQGVSFETAPEGPQIAALTCFTS